MSNPVAIARQPSRNVGRSVFALVVAFVVNAGLSLATDQLFHVLGVYPPWGQPMYEAVPNALALSYRIVFGVLGGWLIARLAPHAPMRLARIGGAIGTVLAAIGAVVAMWYDLGPAWYPITLAIVSYPTVWLGAALHERRRSRR